MKQNLICIILFVVGTLLSCYAQAQDKVPNIILFIGDDISWNDLGCYGNNQVQTPNIDKLANEGIRFSNAYLTASSCSPSRCSIVTGRYPHNTGAAELHMELPKEAILFPELLKNAGYYTAHAGKWHMGENTKRSFHIVNEDRKQNGDGGEEMWVPTLQNRTKEKPFFMWFAAFDAHRIWGPNEFKNSHDPNQVIPPLYHANTPDSRKDLALYYDEIKRFDHYIGKVKDELEAQGELENTIIIVMADNGRPFPRDKTRVYDSGMKTPFIIRWGSGIKKQGTLSESLISAIDIAPTLLNLANIESPNSFQGKSFSKLLNNPGDEFRNYVFAEHNWHDYEACERMVRSKDFMYVLNLRPSFANPGAADITSSPSFQDLRAIRDSGQLSAAQSDVFIKPRPREELYNYNTNLSQLTNIASVPKYKNNLKELRKIMNQWREETADTTPDNLTKDWYDRETGKALPIEQVRGETPGSKNAETTINNGPF